MNHLRTTCDPQRIELFFQQKLSDDEQTAFELHLDDCDSCRQQLETTAANEDAWSAVRDSLRGDCPDFRRAPAQQGGENGTVPFEGLDDSGLDSAAVEEAFSSQSTVLKLLAPTDDDRMLGRWGTYEVVGVVGTGGMGVVLKAFDAALNRYVAIKILAPHLGSSGSARKRFSREAQASAAVVHDNVIEIYGVAEAAGLPYLVMPYVRGPSLQRRLDDKGPLAVVEILRVGMQAAAGLAAAHAQGLVHRDVKPANILLADGIERVKLTDFGLARAADDASLTKTGIIAGTPQYMSPEQARGEPVDQRSDLFSLGSVLYAMCTGRPPFRAETSYGVLRRITDEEPRPIREINPEIPEWLCGIVARLMAKRPDDRFQSAGEVAKLLEECLAHVQQPTAVPLPAYSPLPPGEHPEGTRGVRAMVAPRRRHPWLKAAIALFFFGGLGLTFGILIHLKKDGKTTTVEVPEGSTARVDAQGAVTVELPSSPGSVSADAARGAESALEHARRRYAKEQTSEARDPLVKEYEKLLEAHPDALEGGKIMLSLASLWQSSPNPDHKEELAWLRKACAALPEGSPEWFDAQFRLVGAIHLDQPEEARRILRMLIEKSPDLRYEVKGYYWLQWLARIQGKFDEMESIALKLQNMDLDSSRMPKEMLAKGDVYQEIQKSQRSLMYGWAEMKDVPKAQREAKIRAFAEKARFQAHIDNDMADALETLSHSSAPTMQEKVSETVSESAPRASSTPAGANEPLENNGTLDVDMAHWTVPKSWIRKTPRSTLLQAEYAIPKAEGDMVDGRLTVSQAHGSLEDNILRWKSQFGAKLEREQRDTLEAGEIKITLVDLTGTFNESTTPTAPAVDYLDYRMLGAIFQIPGEEGLHFVKCYGPKKTITDRADEIKRFLTSLKVGAKKPSETSGSTASSPEKAADAPPAPLLRIQTGFPVGTIAVSPDGKLIAAANAGPTRLGLRGGTGVIADNWRPVVKLFDTATGKSVVPLKFTSKEEDALDSDRVTPLEISVLAFSPDGKVVAVGTRWGHLRLCDARNGELLRTLGTDEAGPAAKAAEQAKSARPAMGTIASLAFSPDGATLAACGHTFDEIQPHSHGVRMPRLNGPGILKLWEVKTGTLKEDFAEQADAYAVAFSPDGNWLASLGTWRESVAHGGTGTVLWNLKTSKPFRYLEMSKTTYAVVWAVAFSPDSKLLAMGTQRSDLDSPGWPNTGNVRLVHASNNIEEWSVTVPEWAKPVAFLPDGRTVAALCGGQSIRFLDADTGKLKQDLRPSPQTLRWNDFAIASKTNLFVAGGVDKDRKGVVELWNCKDGAAKVSGTVLKSVPGASSISGTPGKDVTVTSTEPVPGMRPALDQGVFEVPSWRYLVLGQERVRKEIAITPEQWEKLQQISWTYQIERQNALQKPGQSPQAMRDSTNRIWHAALDKVPKVLTPDQSAKLAEIAFRRSAAYMLENPRFLEPMALTSEQKKALQAIQAEMIQEFTRIDREIKDRVLNALTEKQRAELKEALKDGFDVRFFAALCSDPVIRERIGLTLEQIKLLKELNQESGKRAEQLQLKVNEQAIKMLRPDQQQKLRELMQHDDSSDEKSPAVENPSEPEKVPGTVSKSVPGTVASPKSVPGTVASPGMPLRRFDPGFPVGMIALSLDGKLIAAANPGPTRLGLRGGTGVIADNWRPVVKLFDTATGKNVVPVKFTTKEEDALDSENVTPLEIAVLAFSPDGKVVAVGTRSGHLRLCDARTGELLRSLGGEKAGPANKTAENGKSAQRAMGTVASLAFSPDGATLAACGYTFGEMQPHSHGVPLPRLNGPGILKLWDVKTGTLKEDFAELADAHAVAFSPDGNWLASLGTWRKSMDDWGIGAFVWNLKKASKQPRDLDISRRTPYGGVWAIAFSPDGKLLAMGTHRSHMNSPGWPNTGNVRLVDASNNIEEWSVTVPEWAKPVAFLPDGRTVAALCGGQSIRFLDAETGTLKLDMRPSSQTRRWNDFAIAPKGNMLATGGVDKDRKGVVELWDCKDVMAAKAQGPTLGKGPEAGAGETARVLSIRFQGNSQVSDSWLKAQMKLNTGDKVPMRNGRIDREFQAKINADIDRLMVYYNLIGFPGTMIVDQLDIPDRSDELDLTLLIYEDLEVEPASVKLPPPGTRGAKIRLPPAKDATVPPPAIVVQPPGVTVRIMGIGGEDGWWLADGSPMPNPPPPVRDTWPFLNGPMLRAFKVEVDNQTTEDHGLICSITQPAELAAPLPLGLVAGRWHTAPLEFSAYLPENSREATIRVGVASGPWEDIAWRRYDDDGQESGASQGKQASLGPAKATEDSVRITSHDQLPADEVTVVGVAKDGNPIETHYQITGGKGRRQVTATFRGITLKQLKEIKLRRRPYRFVEFRNMAVQPSGKAPSPAEAEEAKLPAMTRKILAALQTPVPAEFVETPLKEVVDYFKDACRIEIHLDGKVLADAKVDTEEPVTFNSLMTLQSDLECILGRLGLADVVTDEVLLITTAEEAKRLLNQGAIDPVARRSPRGAVAVKKIADALHSPTRFEFVETPLEDVVEYLKDAHNIEIVIGLSAAKIKAIPRVTMNLKDVSLASALHLLVRNLGLTYVVKDEYILITTPEKESEKAQGAVSAPDDNASKQNTADPRVQMALKIYTEHRRELERMRQDRAALQGKLDDAEKRFKSASENNTGGAERIELEWQIRGLREQLFVVAERTQAFEKEVAEKKREYEKVLGNAAPR